MVGNGTSSDLKVLDASLWWDSFNLLLTELENVSTSSELPPNLEEKLKENHAWFLDTFKRFKSPNKNSRDALDAKQVKIGSHQLTIQPQLKDAALRFSSLMGLDEVQSYILVDRSVQQNTLDHVLNEFLQLVMVQFYTDRQCILKCTRQILSHALFVESISEENNFIRSEAQKLISEGLESSLFSLLEERLSCSYPDQLDVDLYALWAEQTLVEDNLVLDLLFLAYYESFCSCNCVKWKKIFLLYEGAVSGSLNLMKLSISADAIRLVSYAKVQLLLILIETLELETLLQMVHDEIPFRQGSIAFSLVDVQEMDAMISGLDALLTKEVGPLILAWAVFLCLISSLPGQDDNSVLMEINHVNYVRQAIESASLNYVLDVLESNILKESDGPIAGYCSVLRTFVSAFVASYEINLQQSEDHYLKLIMEVLCKIYREEESLCIQFWDRNSVVDGPIRSLLCSLEGEFPLKAAELVQMLSALAEGAWPAQSAYDFLDKSVGISSLIEMSGDSVVDDSLKIVMTDKPLHVPGVEGLIIPSNTRGQIVRMIDCDTAVVRWEYRQSGLVVLLMRLAQELYLGSTQEVLVILDLLNRLVTFNMEVCYTLTVTGKSCDEVTSEERLPENYPCIDVVAMVCSLVKKQPLTYHGAAVMSMGVSILAKMLKCSPYRVGTMLVKSDIFGVALQKNQFEAGANGLYSEWLLSGKLAKMLCIDCEENDSLLTLSVLDLTIQLVKTAFEDNIVLALVNFSLQCVLVDHDVWRYKSKQARWKVTLKVLEVVKTCITSIAHSQKFGNIIQDMLLSNSSIHNVLFRMVCTAAAGLEKLWSSRLYDIVDIEGLHQAICSALDILFGISSSLSKDLISSSMFHQALLSPVSKPVPVVVALISLISYFQDTKMQINAVRLMSMMFVHGGSFQSLASINSCLGLDPKQISRVRSSVYRILCEQSLWNEELVMAALELLSSAALYQPAFLNALVTSKEDSDALSRNTCTEKLPKSVEMPQSNETNIADIIMQFVRKSGDLMKRNPSMLLKVLNFLKALWQGAPQFTVVLDKLKNTDKFWGHLIDCVTLFSNMSVPENQLDKLSEVGIRNVAYRYYCQSDVLEIISFELFLQRKISHAELLMKENSESSSILTDRVNGAKLANHHSTQSLSDVLSTSFKSSLVNLIKSYASCTYDSKLHLQANVASSLFVVHMMEKLKSGDMGHTSVSVVGKILSLSEKMKNLPAFSDLMARYTKYGYSQGKNSQYLILNDLFYHLEGELEGRQIDDRSFKEIMFFLLQSNFLSTYFSKSPEGLQELDDGLTLYNLSFLQSDLALELWDLSEWKASKLVPEKMLHFLKDVNGMILLSNSKLSALKALVAMLSLYSNHSTVNVTMIGGEMSSQLLSSSIDHTCQCLHATTEALGTGPNASDDVVNILSAQLQLLIYLTKTRRENLSSSTCVLILRTSGQCLRVLSCFKLSNASVLQEATKHLLMLILLSLELNFKESHFGVRFARDSIEEIADISSTSLGLLPILCQYIHLSDHYILSLSSIGIILRSFSTPDVWLPIIQKHLQLHYVIQKLVDNKHHATIPVVLEFLLTLSRVREGARMLLDAGFLSTLRGVLAYLSDDMPFLVVQTEKTSPPNGTISNNEKPKHIWGLCLAVVASVIQSLGDVSSKSIVDYVIAYVLVEKADVVSYFLSAPEFLVNNDHEKKRARSLKSAATLNSLKETEQTLMLICVVARHWNSWNKAMREMDSQFRERIIHLLACISRGNRELPSRIVPFLCHPVIKEEFEWYKKPSFVNSRNGWFALSPLGCGLDPKFSSLSSATSSSLIVKGQSNESVNQTSQTQFSDMTAIQIYRNTFLLLKFLCIQAEGAAKRAEEVGYVDLAEFPELPMPDILHNLQDQGIVIVTELCEANKSKEATPEIQGICQLLLQITTMSLHLEFCVIQICGIRTVHGRAEEFLKLLSLLLQGTKGHGFLKEGMNRLRQLILFVYPDLLQANAFI